MTVQNEQERLVADTLAFVQRLAEQPAETAVPTTFATATAAPRVPRYATETDLRQEMRSRLEAFRNKQRFLEIEREAYYQQAMQRIRAVTDSYAPL